MNNLDHLEPIKENFDLAIRYLFKVMLRDLRPPWLAHAFPQALPGIGVLSRFTRPSFLQWDGAVGSNIFGETVVKLLTDVVEAVQLELKGFLAKPLYVCTSTSRSESLMCMSIASMSKLITHAEGRLLYLCGNCVQEDEGEPASGIFPLSVIHLYALVGAGGQVLTPLHSKPVRLVVSAPPTNWAWGTHQVWPDRPRSDSPSASPERSKDWRGWHWRYCLPDSESIWRQSGPYLGQPSE